MSNEPTSASPATRNDELLARHAAARRRRNTAALGSREFEAACEEIARIEVEIARLGRSANPPVV